MAVIFSNKCKELIFGFREHSHPYAEIIITTQGEGTTIVEENRFEIKKVQLRIVNREI